MVAMLTPSEIKGIKVLHVARTVNPSYGGPITWIQQTCRCESSNGCTFEILTTDDPAEQWVADFPVKVHACGPGVGTYGKSKQIGKWLTEHAREYDAIFLNAIWQYPALIAGKVAVHQKVPYFIIPHGMYDQYFHKKANFRAFKRFCYWIIKFKSVAKGATGFIWTSDLEREEIASLYRVDVPNHTIRFGAEFEDFDHHAMDKALAEYAPQLVDKPFILTLGRLAEVKNLKNLIKGFALASSMGLDLQLLLAGPDEHGNMGELRNLAQSLQVSDQVHMPGFIMGAGKASAFRHCRFFACPSYLESFGLSVAEALAYGKPVLISDQVKIRSKLGGYSTGTICQTDSGSIAEKLLEMASWTPEQYQTQCEEARRCFENELTVQGSAIDLVNIVRNIPKDTNATGQSVILPASALTESSDRPTIGLN